MPDTYIAILDLAEDATYGVSFPDMPGCVSGGDTIEEALHNAGEALDMHIEGMAEDGEAAPAPSEFATILAEPGHQAGAVLFAMVTARPPAARKVRLNINLDSDLLAESDRLAAAEGRSRSAYIAAALAARNRLRAGARGRPAKPSAVIGRRQAKV